MPSRHRPGWSVAILLAGCSPDSVPGSARTVLPTEGSCLVYEAGRVDILTEDGVPILVGGAALIELDDGTVLHSDDAPTASRESISGPLGEGELLTVQSGALTWEITAWASGVYTFAATAG